MTDLSQLPHGLRPRGLVARDVPPHDLHDIDPVLARVLAARGVKNSQQLDMSLKRLAPVGLLANIDAAVDLLLLHQASHIVIVGDFDADGATSTALMLRCLARLGFGSVESLVPNRFDYGYGLSPEIVDVAAKDSPSLIVTVDNGISSHAGVDRANELGIDVLVTDHHLPAPALPAAKVIVNPNLPGDGYPSKSLAGVGVAFCLMAALARKLSAGDPGLARIPADYLDLVALGTVADVVPLDDNNRILVAAGLQRIRAGRCVPGISALLSVAGRDPARIVTADLGFALGPRLNAAGRLEDMSIGIRCLTTDDGSAASAIAQQLDAINRARRELESDMQRDALEVVEQITQSLDTALPDCLCLYEPHWHQGVVGLVASRIKEATGRPVFAFANEDEDTLKGSGRSINGVHIRDLLAAVQARHPGLIGRFGGHAMAAGLSLPAGHLTAFRNAVASQQRELFPEADFAPAMHTDGELPESHLTLEFAEQLRRIAPWGQHFPEPLFTGTFAVVDARIVGEKHLKLQLAHGALRIDAIAFNQAREPMPQPGESLLLAYRLEVNVWRQRQTTQLIVEQWQSIA
ncbi:MAG: single-stranded-DNA-specific exonuclease RecJ [Pseudomonadota bacterium]